MRDGYSREPRFKPNATEFEDGPIRMRRQSTIVADKEDVSIVMTAAQVADFESFYTTTVAAGSSRFTMQVDRNGARSSRTCEIEGGTYTITPYGKGFRVRFSRIVYL